MRVLLGMAGVLLLLMLVVGLVLGAVLGVDAEVASGLDAPGFYAAADAPAASPAGLADAERSSEASGVVEANTLSYTNGDAEATSITAATEAGGAPGVRPGVVAAATDTLGRPTQTGRFAGACV